MPADTRSAILNLLLQGTGNNDNTWGDLLDTEVIQLIEDAIAGGSTIPVTGGSTSLTTAQARTHILQYTGTLGSAQTIVVPNATKSWIMRNGTSGSFALSVKTASGTGVNVPQGSWCHVWCNGSDTIYVSEGEDTANGWSQSAAGQVSGYAGGVEKLRISTALAPNAIQAFDTLTLRNALTGSTAINLNCQASSTSYDSSQIVTNCARSASSSFNHWICGTSNGGNISGYFRGDGWMAIDGSYVSGGADYAEYFEWADGNPNRQDRVGYSVKLDGHKIVLAEPGDTHDILGIISATPTVIGDSAELAWQDKYLRDDFGRRVMEEYRSVSWTERWIETVTEKWFEEVEVKLSKEDVGLIALGRKIAPEGKQVIMVEKSNTKQVPKSRVQEFLVEDIPPGTVPPADAEYKLMARPKVNPAYDPDNKYVPRSQRPEWDAVGFMGKLAMRKGQPTHPRWRKLRDISPDVELWLVR